MFLSTDHVARLVGLDPLLDRQLGAEVALDGLIEAGHVPLLLGGALGHVLIDELRDHVLAHALDGLAHVLRAHQIGALLVDHAALIVGDVVVFEQLLAGIEVVLLDAALRALDLAREHAALDRLARLHADARHERLHARRIAEDAHQLSSSDR